MKILIRDKETKQFLGRDETWVTAIRSAETFESGELARRAISERGLKRAQVYYSFGEAPTEWDFPV
ncbi:MAG: hypothetical protein U1G07_11445 [Verrucomicrobiota bacterium]